MNFGGFIKNRRIQLNLTQAELSSFLHITPQGLSNYENGKTKVPLSLVLELCASLNLDINDFFLLKENAPNSNPDLTDYNFDNISKNIAFLRESNKLTLKELSKNVNISIKRLSDFELNNASPSIEEFISLCDYYKKPYDELFLITPKKETNNNSVINKKRKINKLLIAAICSFIFLGTTVGISTPIIVNTIKENQISKTSPIIKNFYLTNTANSEEPISDLGKELIGYLVLELINPFECKISSFKANDVFYHSQHFIKYSFEKIVVQVNFSSYNFGEHDFVINEYSFIDTDSKKRAIHAEDKILKFNVINNDIPRLRIANQSITTTTAEFHVVFNDYYNVIKDRRFKVHLKTGKKEIQTTVAQDYFKFENLEPGTDYKVICTIEADFFDGLDYQERIILNHEFQTTPSVSFNITKVAPTAVYFDMTLGENTVIQEIALKNEENGNLQTVSTKVINNISGLISNNLYKIIITSITETLVQKHEYTFKTLNVASPIVNLDDIEIAETSIKIVPKVSFKVDTFKFNYIEIRNGRGETVAKHDKEDTAYIFDNLLSSTNYRFYYNYSFDLLDGKGVRTKTLNKGVTTKTFKKPAMEFKPIKVTKNSIYFEAADKMDKIAPNYIETRLYKNSDLIETTKERKYTFTGLESDVTYLVETHYSYNLLDGKGDINETLRATVVTNENSIIYEEIK